MDSFSRAYLQEEAQKAFFRAMREGYATEKPAFVEFAHPQIPNSKTIEYAQGEWKVRDCYTKGENGFSAGWTLITCRDLPVWHMQYEGRYERRAIQFLKAALLQKYSENLFEGGRGPEIFHSPEWSNLVYLNGAQGNFAKFSGIEGVRDVADGVKSLGYHRYQGGMLLL